LPIVGGATRTRPGRPIVWRPRYQTRAAKLRLFADGPYPFISEQAIVKSGKREHWTYAIDVSYPQFDSPSADFTAVNRSFADPARDTVDDLVQSEFNVSYDQTFDLFRLNRDVVSVWVHSEMSGLNIDISNTGTLVDLRTGRVIPPRTSSSRAENGERGC